MNLAHPTGIRVKITFVNGRAQNFIVPVDSLYQHFVNCAEIQQRSKVLRVETYARHYRCEHRHGDGLPAQN